MNLIQSLFWVFILIIPVQILAQKDTLKPNFGINHLQFGVAQPADVCAYYGKHRCRWQHSSNLRYKKLKVNELTFLFVKVDSIFLLELVRIPPTRNKFYIKEDFNFSPRTKIKDVVNSFDSINLLRSDELYTLSQVAVLSMDGLLFNILQKKGTRIETSSYLPQEDFLKKYANSKISHLTLHCGGRNCDFQFYPTVEKRKQNLQLFYSKHKHHTYYKDKDSLLRISVNSCTKCSHPPYFSIYFYTQKQQLKKSYSFKSFPPLIDEEEDPSKNLRQLKKIALQKKEYFYFGKHRYTVHWERKNIHSPYLIQEIKHNIL